MSIGTDICNRLESMIGEEWYVWYNNLVLGEEKWAYSICRGKLKPSDFKIFIFPFICC
jgi:hypothetical protein